MVAFRWTMSDFQTWAAEQTGKKEPLTSPTHIDKEYIFHLFTCQVVIGQFVIRQFNKLITFKLIV